MNNPTLSLHMAAALPPVAAQTLLLARQFDRSVDPASVWLAYATHPTAGHVRLAQYVRAEARRNRRQGGVHGPSSFASIDDGPCDFWDDHSDPAELLAACQAVAHRPGLANALAEREPVSDARALAQREHISRRRAQQLLGRQAAAEAAGQLCLFGGAQ